jgi:hypothetical protein
MNVKTKRLKKRRLKQNTENIRNEVDELRQDNLEAARKQRSKMNKEKIIKKKRKNARD